MCKHPNVKLLISWTVDMTTEGPEVLVSVVQNASLRAVVVKCPDCGLRDSTYTTMGAPGVQKTWQDRWPKWLSNRVRQLASGNASLRQAVNNVRATSAAGNIHFRVMATPPNVRDGGQRVLLNWRGRPPVVKKTGRKRGAYAGGHFGPYASRSA